MIGYSLRILCGFINWANRYGLEILIGQCFDCELSFFLNNISDILDIIRCYNDLI